VGEWGKKIRILGTWNLELGTLNPESAEDEDEDEPSTLNTEH
jgi:hypothetical protein